MKEDIPWATGMRTSAALALMLGWLLVCAMPSYADYEPQGGDPPRGGSRTSGMRL